MGHMEGNGLFTKHQHGFRKGYSCVTQLIDVCDKWSEELDNKNSIDAIYLDFQKAFDSVPHQRLLLKLKGYGIQGRLLKWIENFLKDRKLEDHWSCSSPERLSHCKLMRFKLIENQPMKVYAWTLLTPGAWPNLTQGHDWHNL